MKRADLLAFLADRSDECGGCLIWQFAINAAGHPVASIAGRRSIPVRRWAWETWHRKAAGALRVVQNCGDSRCVNPRHADAITPGAVNLLISARGGMSTPAVRLARAKSGRSASPLTIDDVREIRARRAAGELLGQIAADYPVQVGTISRICLGRSWVDHQANPFALLFKVAA